jgi:hypothetical protein
MRKSDRPTRGFSDPIVGWVYKRIVMAGHSRSENSVTPFGYVPAISIMNSRWCLTCQDARHKAGHNALRLMLLALCFFPYGHGQVGENNVKRKRTNTPRSQNPRA